MVSCDAGLKLIDMRLIDEVGMRQAMELAWSGLDLRTHLHVSFDVDFLDTEIAPGVGTVCAAAPATERRNFAWR